MPINRTQIARAIFSAAESMGISDRKHIENIVDQVIERTEQRSLPGMESLVPEGKTKVRYTPSVSEIQSMVKEILINEDEEKRKENQPNMTTMTKAKLTSESNVSAGKDKTMSKSCQEIGLTDNARQVLEKRYLKKEKSGKVIETPAELFRRVAQTVAVAETVYYPEADTKIKEEEFFKVMSNLDFLPNSPTLMNAGRELGQLSACFVLPVGDSMEEIFDAVKYTALIHKSGGGTGFSFSRLRPHQDRVGSTGGIASGPVSFIRAFDTATDVIKQGGMRRGANMGILSVDHPDILQFISAKDDMVSLTNFNLSVAVTKKFMEAVKAGTEYELINPHNHEVSGKLNAKDVFDKIVNGAWKTGDPGVIFIDRINQDNPTPNLGKIESTNPCGEQPLLPYESCNLGSINLAHMLKNNSSQECEIDWPKLAKTIHIGVRFLDNVIDVNKFPLPQIEERTKETRKIGLGVMGFADMLLQLRIPYNSEEGLKVASNIMHFISDEALKASQELAAERGVFPAFEGSIYDVPNGLRVRNAARTTIAPTGTLSIIASCSGGIEPIFALSFTKNILDGAHLVEVNPYFEAAAKQGGFYSKELMQKLADGEHLRNIEGIPDEVKRVFVTAHEISPEWHIKMQAAFQKYTDNAVSKTVNFPKEATKEDVAKVYLMAFEEGLKGITIYRDGSREGQVLTTGKEKKSEPTTTQPVSVSRTPRKRSKVTHGCTEKVTTGCGSIYVTVNSDDQGICEVFTTLGKAGGCAMAQIEATSRLISQALRAGVDIEVIVRQLRGIRCPSIAWEDGKSVLSCADAIASVLEKFTAAAKANSNGNGNGHNHNSKTGVQDFGLVKNTAGQCPECATILVNQEGCFVCPGCGYTKC